MSFLGADTLYWKNREIQAATALIATRSTSTTSSTTTSKKNSSINNKENNDGAKSTSVSVVQRQQGNSSSGHRRRSRRSRKHMQKPSEVLKMVISQTTTATKPVEKKQIPQLMDLDLQVQNEEVEEEDNAAAYEERNTEIEEDVVNQVQKTQIILGRNVRPPNNSSLNFVPILTVKPNAKKPLNLVPVQKVSGGVSEFQYEHPYQYEIESWSPSPAQLKSAGTHRPRSIDSCLRPLILINTQDSFNSMLSDLSFCTEFGVDLEHHSTHSFLGHTCIIQLSTRSQDYIIDWLASPPLALQGLNHVFTNPDIIKIFHGANSDITWLQRDCGVYVVGLFDTFVAGKALRLRELSLSYLLKKYCGIEFGTKLKKKYQLADWRIRPMPPDMIYYARQDTHYLPYIYDLMKNQLISKSSKNNNLLTKVFMESSKLCLQRYEKPTYNLAALLSSRQSTYQFNSTQLTTASELNKWRVSTARELDVSVGYIMSNASLLKIVSELPSNKVELLKCWTNHNDELQLTNNSTSTATNGNHLLDSVTNILCQVSEILQIEPLDTTAFKLWKQKLINNNHQLKEVTEDKLKTRWEHNTDKYVRRTWRWAAAEYLESLPKPELPASTKRSNDKKKPIINRVDDEYSSDSDTDELPVNGARDLLVIPSKKNPAAQQQQQAINGITNQMLGLSLLSSPSAAAAFSTSNGSNCSNSIYDLPLIPTTQELLAKQHNYCPVNCIGSSYRNHGHYLDVHFRLLREDFVRSIRLGLGEFIKTRCTKNLNSIRVHDNIYIIRNPKKRTDWTFELPDSLFNLLNSGGDNSKRFLPGSLLLFSKDWFNTIYFGLITPIGQDSFLNTGRFHVNFEGGVPSHWERNEKFLTIELDAYFEPYRRVLSSLRAGYFEECALSPYLIDFSKHLAKSSNNNMSSCPKYLVGTKKYAVREFSVNPMVDSSWPSAKRLGFDVAQFKAYQAALRQDFTIIQGPPGTGKTYLGVQIIKTLIDNKALWRGGDDEGARGGGPIIVSCYTNHALDQFLEGVLDAFTPDSEKQNSNPYIVQSPKIRRIGGGSSSERVANYVTNKVSPEPDIIFITTTGAAKRLKSLAKLQCAIMIIEEAAEVFESHISALFTPHLQQLVLLGDHKQLRPICATNHMADKYRLDVSLFERLVRLGFERQVLSVQHRMRPSIRNLITGTIYRTLTDGPSVSKYPPVLGTACDVFFINHSAPEAQPPDSFSTSNAWEAEYCVGLAQYLILQGYEAERIVILATYMAQVCLLQKLISGIAICRALAVETADSYQGEENDIVLLSLVRSNDRNQIGFMRTDNRICVALSRAKHGLFIVGNMNLLSSNRHTWRKIHDKLLKKRQIGSKLELNVCERHQTRVWIEQPSDFNDIIKNGCRVCHRKYL